MSTPRPVAQPVTVTRADAAITYILGGAAMWLSFSALHSLALDRGFGRAESVVLPLVVDGLILVATRAVVEFGDHRSRLYAWSLLWVAALASIAGNAVSHGLADPVGVVMAVIPPAFAIAVTHLVVVRARVRADLAATQPVTRDATLLDVPATRDADAPRDATPDATQADATPAADAATRRPQAPAAEVRRDTATPDATRRDTARRDATQPAPAAATHDASATTPRRDATRRDASPQAEGATHDVTRPVARNVTLGGDAPLVTPGRPVLRAVVDPEPAATHPADAADATPDAPRRDTPTQPDADPTRDATPPADDLDALRRRARELADEGLSNYVIGEMIGKSEGTVRRYLKSS